MRGKRRGRKIIGVRSSIINDTWLCNDLWVAADLVGIEQKMRVVFEAMKVVVGPL